MMREFPGFIKFFSNAVATNKDDAPPESNPMQKTAIKYIIML